MSVIKTTLHNAQRRVTIYNRGDIEEMNANFQE